ncbi:MAG: hypothetical protein JST38_18515 [Bacteroidetes bacterium]|nr:hypothetical protein [Bacteroidota bacterium]
MNGSQLLDFNDATNGLNTCNLPTGQDYNGAPAQYSQNVEYDETGKLLFFVVDGNIYDNAGYKMADNGANPNCVNCLVKGTQEIAIIRMPNTCDKYFIIGANRLGLRGVIGYSVLDLSKPNPFHPGRFGAVWSDADAINAGEEVTIANPMYSNFEGMTYPGSGYYTALLGHVDDPNYVDDNINAQIKVMDSGDPNRPAILLVRNQSELFVGEITEHGILNYHSVRILFNTPSDNALHYSGQLDVAVENAVDQTYILAMSMNDDDHPTATLNRSIELSRIDFNNGQVSNSVIATVNTNLYGANQGLGKVHGIAFSPNGHYLYFAQAFAPFIGYIDLTDPTYPVHDLVSELGLTGMAAYGTGQLAGNRSPDGSTEAIYFPYAGGMGCLSHVDQPLLLTQLSWTASVSVGGAPVSTPPNSLLSTTDNPAHNQYLMDLQNFDDQQLANLQRQTCCFSNEHIPESNHAYTFNGITTYASPWTPQNNPLAPPILCAGSGSYLYFDQDFTVQTGARLYVRDMEWRFAPTARLIIEKGAFVQFDNCLLRGDICNPSRWPGVRLRGTPNLAQGYSLYPPDQGHMVFNSSTLQDAEIGVTMGEKLPLPPPMNIVQYAGGILETNNSNFTNCRVGVNFYPYKNFNPSTNVSLPNRSRFNTTTFTVDADYIAPYDFTVHAQLWKVDGIWFKSCVFGNYRTTETNSSQLGQGIRSLDANYTVAGGCAQLLPPNSMCPQQYQLPSRFFNLDHGIHAFKASNMLSFIAKESVFTDNVCGVYVRGVPGFQVVKNTFNIGGSHATNLDNIEEDNWQGANRGTYSFLSQGFQLKHNGAQPSAAYVTGTNTEGFITGWSGASDDLVRWNTTTNLNVGFAGEGICAIQTLVPIHGLLYRCNDTNGDDKGIWARTVPISPAQDPYQIIRYFQGNSGAPAGNKFIGNAVDLKNDNPDRWFSYWWWQPQPVPYQPVTTVGLIDVHSSEKDIRCDDLFPVQPIQEGDVAPPETEPVAYRSWLMGVAQARKLEYGNTRYLYDQLIDGGNTDETVQEIQETWPSEAWEMRAMLMQKSPYLSAEVLMEAVKKNIMPAAMVAEIYIANPEAVQRAGLLKWLQYEAPIVMPQYLLDNIAASWDQKTYRSTLEENLSFSRGEMSQAIYHVLASYNADTTGVPVDSIRATLQVLRTPDARYMEILTYLQQDNFDSAYAVMDRLPVEFNLSEKEESEKDRTKQYIGLVQGWRSAGRSDAELNESELTALQALVEGYYDRPAEWAQNLLCFGYGICRAPLSGGNGGQPVFMRKPVTSTVAPAPLLKLAPNPADAWVAINYRLETTADEAHLIVRDANGRELDLIPVAQAEGQAVYDTRRLAPGNYTVELVNAGKHVDAQKLVVR